MKSSQKTFAIWIFLLLAVVFFGQQYSMKKQTAIKDFSYPQFIAAVKEGKVKKDSIVFYTVKGEIGGEVKDEFKEELKGSKFKFAGNIGDEGFKKLEGMGITPGYDNQDESMWIAVLFNFLPLLLIIGLFLFFMKQLQSGGGKALSFGKSKAKLLNETNKKVTFKDVAGVEEAKDDLEEIVQFLKDPKKFTKLGGRIPKGVLLVGPPGTGKTLLARAVAGEAGVPFFSISGSDFVEMFVGVGASRVRDMFDQGKRNSPCIIFIDEIDAVGRHRGAGMGGGHDEREQTLNQLLVEMDGFEGNSGVIIIAATNRADVLDPALLRPGRFDRRIMVGKPDLNGRYEILKVHTKKTPLSSDVDLKKIARGTPGFSGADLENLINESALLAARNNKSLIDGSDVENAKDKVLMGSERKSMIISDEDKKITAYHEAGHTLVGKIIPGLDPIHKVTIIPRGMALGVTQTLPEGDSVNITRTKAKNMIAFLFGGRAAEELIFEDITTGAGNDIERATDIAWKMVTEWGMSEKLGPLSYGSGSGPVFQGLQQNQNTNNYSDTKALEIDREVEDIIKEGYTRAVGVLRENKDALERLTQALLEFETIDGAEVELLVKGASLEDIKSRREDNEQLLLSEHEKKKEEVSEAAVPEVPSKIKLSSDPSESPA
jgi:cell division protease FtsH